MTLREMVWRLLDEEGPMSSINAAKRLGLDRNRVSDACGKLCQRGLARRVDDGQQGSIAQYEAIGEFIPDPRKEEPTGPCFLAECWGWMPQRVEAKHA